MDVMKFQPLPYIIPCYQRWQQSPQAAPTNVGGGNKRRWLELFLGTMEALQKSNKSLRRRCHGRALGLPLRWFSQAVLWPRGQHDHHDREGSAGITEGLQYSLTESLGEHCRILKYDAKRKWKCYEIHREGERLCKSLQFSSNVHCSRLQDSSLVCRSAELPCDC